MRGLALAFLLLMSVSSVVGSPILLVASDEGYPDAVVAQGAAKQIGVFVASVSKESVPKDTEALIEAVEPSEIIVVGGPAVIGDSVVARLSEGASVDRVWGITRYETAAQLAFRLYSGGSETAFLVEDDLRRPDYRFPIQTVQLVREGDGPVLLVSSDGIPLPTLNALEVLGVSRVTYVGKKPSEAVLSGLNSLGIALERTVFASDFHSLFRRVRAEAPPTTGSSIALIAGSSAVDSVRALFSGSGDRYFVFTGDEIGSIVSMITGIPDLSVSVVGVPVLRERLENALTTKGVLFESYGSDGRELGFDMSLANENSTVAVRRKHELSRMVIEERLKQRRLDRANLSLGLGYAAVTFNDPEVFARLEVGGIALDGGDSATALKVSMEVRQAVEARRYDRIKADEPALTAAVERERGSIEEYISAVVSDSDDIRAIFSENLTLQDQLNAVRLISLEPEGSLLRNVSSFSSSGGSFTEAIKEVLRSNRITAISKPRISLTCGMDNVSRVVLGSDFVALEPVINYRGFFSLSSPGYSVDSEVDVVSAGVVDVTVVFSPIPGIQAECLGNFRVTRRIPLESGSWRVRTRALDGETEFFSTEADVEVLAPGGRGVEAK